MKPHFNEVANFNFYWLDTLNDKSSSNPTTMTGVVRARITLAAASAAYNAERPYTLTELDLEMEGSRP